MADLPPNVIRFPRPYRQPPQQKLVAPATPKRPRRSTYLTERQRECVENFVARCAHMNAQEKR